MGIFWKPAVVVAPAALLAGCVSYPYQSAFEACDAEAGACYEYCEQFAEDEEEYRACHAGCEEGANQCFAAAYDEYRYASSRYAYSPYDPWPWAGRYGYWRPGDGYYFSFDYYGGRRHYSPYYYGRHGYRGGRRGYYGGGRHPGAGQSGGGTPPPQSAPPKSSPPPASPPKAPRVERRKSKQTPRNREDRRHRQPR